MRFYRLDTGEPLLTPAEARLAAEAEVARLREELRRRPAVEFSPDRRLASVGRGQAARRLQTAADTRRIERGGPPFILHFALGSLRRGPVRLSKSLQYRRQDKPIGSAEAALYGKYDAALILEIIHNYGLLSSGRRRLFLRQGPPRAAQLPSHFPARACNTGQAIGIRDKFRQNRPAGAKGAVDMPVEDRRNSMAAKHLRIFVGTAFCRAT